MSRIFIADKPTLDAVNTKVGETTDSGATPTGGSLMGKHNAVLGWLQGTLWTAVSSIKSGMDTLSSGWTSERASAIDSINANAATAGTQATAAASDAAAAKTNTATNNSSSSTGTLSQKLSYIISQISGQGQGISNAGRQKSSKFVSTTYLASTTTTLLDITGAGELIFVYIGGQTSSGLTLNLTIDSVNYSLAAAGGRSYGIGTSYVDGNMLSHITDSQRYVVPISFAKNCKVTLANSGTTTAPCKVLYNKYEGAN